MSIVKVRTKVTLQLEVDLDVSFDRRNMEAIILGGEISPTFSVRPRQIHESLTKGEFQALDKSASNQVLEEATASWREFINKHPSEIPEHGIRTIPMPVSNWAAFMKKEKGPRTRMAVDMVAKYLGAFRVLAEPALERQPSLYVWEMEKGSDVFDRISQHAKSQISGAITERMPEGSMRVYWNRNH